MPPRNLAYNTIDCQITLRVPRTLRNELHEMAAQRGVTLNAYLNQILTEDTRTWRARMDG